MIFMCTVRSMGEASRKSSSSEGQYPSAPGTSMDNSNEVRFGKAKWPKNGNLSEHKTNFFKLTALVKRGTEGGVIVSGWPSKLI